MSKIPKTNSVPISLIFIKDITAEKFERAAKETQGKKPLIKFLQSLDCEFEIVPYEPEMVTCLDCGAHFPENGTCPGCHAERN